MARDENDLTDEELLEMWEQGEPVKVARAEDARRPAKGSEETPSTSAGRGAPAERKDA